MAQCAAVVCCTQKHAACSMCFVLVPCMPSPMQAQAVHALLLFLAHERMKGRRSLVYERKVPLKTLAQTLI